MKLYSYIIKIIQNKFNSYYQSRKVGNNNSGESFHESSFLDNNYNNEKEVKNNGKRKFRQLGQLQ